MQMRRDGARNELRKPARIEERTEGGRQATFDAGISRHRSRARAAEHIGDAVSMKTANETFGRIGS